MKLGAFLLAGINADLYNHGKSEGDTVMNMDGNGISKVPLSSTANIFNVNKDVLWFSNSGAISFNALDDNNLESLKENFVVAPMWGTGSDGSVPSSGKVFYRTVSAVGDLSDLQTDINKSTDMQSIGQFQISDAFIATYKNVINPLNSDQRNQYQVVIARGMIAGTVQEKTVIIFNYHMMEWLPDTSNIGVFAAAAENEQCHTFLDQNLAMENLAVGSNINEPGKWIMIHTTDLECIDKFETECPEPEAGTRASYSGMMSTMGSESPDNWQFYALHECIPGHEITTDVDSLISTCVYDADYYDARWQYEAPTCVDENARKTFEVKVVVEKISNEPAQKVIDESPERGEMNILIEESIGQLIDLIGAKEADVSDVSIKPYDPENFKDPEDPEGRGEETLPNEGQLQVEFEIKLPLAVKDKVTDNDIVENIKNILSEEPVLNEIQFDEEDVFVEDTTPSCLTECLGCQDPKNCGSKPPPIPFDACCGSCPEDNPARGKPYSSIIKACCTDGWNGEIYDPDTHVCCNGEVIEKADYAFSFFTRSQCD